MIYIYKKTFFIFIFFFLLLSCGKTNSVTKPSVDKEPIDDTVFILKESLLTEGNIRISYPEDWEVVNDESAIFAAKMECDSSEVFCPNVVLTIFNNEDHISLQDYGDKVLSRLDSEVEYLKIVDQKEETINGLRVLILDYKFILNNIKLGGTSALYEDRNRIIDLGCMAPNNNGGYAGYRKIFQKIIHSLGLMHNS